MSTVEDAEYLRTEKPKARLENWWVGNNDLLYGEVYDHPEHSDGTVVTTSRVVKLNLESGKAETLNTHYELGSPRKKSND